MTRPMACCRKKGLRYPSHATERELDIHPVASVVEGFADTPQVGIQDQRLPWASMVKTHQLQQHEGERCG